MHWFVLWFFIKKFITGFFIGVILRALIARFFGKCSFKGIVNTGIVLGFIWIVIWFIPSANVRSRSSSYPSLGGIKLYVYVSHSPGLVYMLFNFANLHSIF